MNYITIQNHIYPAHDILRFHIIIINFGFQQKFEKNIIRPPFTLIRLYYSFVILIYTGGGGGNKFTS